MDDLLSGLLGSIDPAKLQGLLSALSQPTPEMQAQADKQKWLTTGLGILAARPGNVWNAVGQGGLLGVQAGNESLQQQLAQRAQGVQQASGLLNFANQADQLNQNLAGRQVLQDFYKQKGMPNSPAALDTQPPSGGMQPPSSQMGPPDPNMPMPATAGASGAPPTLGVPNTGVPPKTSVYQQYKQIGDLMAAKGATGPAQQYYDLAEKYRPKLKETKTLMQGDRRVTVNLYDDGSTEVLPLGPEPEKAHFLDTGNDIFPVDPITGKPVGKAGQVPIYPKTVTPGEAQSNALGYANLKETTRYHNLELGLSEDGTGTGNIDAVARAIAAYQQPGLSSFAMGKPLGAAIMGKVMEVNPTYDAKNYATAQQTMNAFAKGPEARTTRSIGVALQHMDVLNQANDALNNGDVQLFNKMGNFVSTQTGGPAPTNFNAVKDIVSNEIVKAIVGSGGGVGDRDKAQQVVSAANSPAQLKAVLDSYRSLFVGQLNGLRQQYEAGSQQKDFDKFLSPEVKAMVAAKGGARQVYIDAKGNRAYRNPDGSYTEIK